MPRPNEETINAILVEIDAAQLLVQKKLPPPYDFHSLKEEVLNQSLADEIAILRKMLTEDDLLHQFKIRCEERARENKDTCLSFFDMPHGACNALYWKIAEILFQPAQMHEMLAIIAPDLKTQITYEVMLDDITKRPGADNVTFVFEKKHLSTLNNPPLLERLSQYVTVDSYLLDVEDIALLTLNLHQKYHQLLRDQYPSLAVKLYRHNPALVKLLQYLEMLNENGTTPFMVLQHFKDALLLGGSRMAGDVYASQSVQQAVTDFFCYIESLPAATKTTLLSLGIEDVIQHLKKGNCVEAAAHSIQRIIEVKADQTFLNTPPLLSKEYIQRIQKEYGATNPLPFRVDSSNTTLPPALLAKALHKIKVHNLEQLISVLIAYPTALYTSLFDALGNKVFKRLVTSVVDLVNVLIMLDKERFKIILESEQIKLPSIIRAPGDLSYVLAAFDFEQRLLILNRVKDSIPTMSSKKCLINFLFYFKTEQFAEVLALSKPNLRYAKMTVDSIKENIATLNRTETIKQIGQLSTINLLIFSIEIPVEQLKPMLHELAEHLCPKLIKSPQDLSAWLRTMNKECRAIVCGVLKEKHLSLQSRNWLLGVFDYLEADQQKDLIEVVKDKLPEIIRTSADMNSLLRRVNTEEYKTIYEALQPQFARLVPSINELRHVCLYFNASQQRAFFETIKSELPRLLNSISDLEDLVASQINVNYVLFRIALSLLMPPSLVRPPPLDLPPGLTPYNLQVSHEQSVDIIKIVLQKLAILIQTPSDLSKVLKLIEHHTVGQALVIEAVKDKLAHFILESPDLNLRDIIFESLTPASRSKVYGEITGQPVPAEITDELLQKIKSARISISGSINPFRNVKVNQSTADKQKALQPLLMRFELAVAQNQDHESKTAFAELYRVANTHRSKIGFFQKGMTHSAAQLCDGVAKSPYMSHLNLL